MSDNKHEQNINLQNGSKNFPSFKQVTNNIAYEKDVEYMKQLYPADLKYIQAEVDEQCDKLEYAGSFMFDEYPDKNHLRMIVDTILKKINSDQNNPPTVEKASLDTNILQYCSDDAMADCIEEENILNNRNSESNPSTRSVNCCDVFTERPFSQKTDTDKASEQAACFGPSCNNPGHWIPWPFWPPRPPFPPGPGPRPPFPPGPGPRPPFPPRPWPPCGPYCPYANRACGDGKYCPPDPLPDMKEDGGPDWLRHLVENMLSNEMNYRRNRYRSLNS